MKVLFIVLLTSVLIFYSQGQEPQLVSNKTIDSIASYNRNLIKDYFLCSCINYGFSSDSLFLKKDHSMSVLVEQSNYLPIAFNKIDSLAKIVVAQVPLSDFSGKRGIFVNCLSFYKGPELEEFVYTLDNELDKRK